MKKIYILATALFFGANANAQELIDFESFNLPAAIDTFYNGADDNGDFTIDYATFSNMYNTTYSSWTGFSVSNTTDVTTAGFSNQYSSFVGSGANSSVTYGVFYSNGIIVTDGSVKLNSVMITNTTYAAISMRDGDAYAKKFGESVNAAGDDDGTNGEDFLKVWIIAEDLAGNEKDSVEFFLADYRFADNTQDYIIDAWTSVDLTGFNFLVQKLSFKIESSDVGGFGMNTPAYFAIDDIDAVKLDASIEENTLNISVYPNPVENILTVNGEYGIITITNVNGQVVYTEGHSTTSQIDMSKFEKGVYFLRLTNNNGSAVQRIIK